jgi:hypothetical protein
MNSRRDSPFLCANETTEQSEDAPDRTDRIQRMLLTTIVGVRYVRRSPLRLSAIRERVSNRHVYRNADVTASVRFEHSGRIHDGCPSSRKVARKERDYAEQHGHGKINLNVDWPHLEENGREHARRHCRSS